MKNKTIIKIILTLIILAGIVVTCINGFNFGLNYRAHKDIDIYIGQEFKNQDIYDIVKEVVGNQEIAVQKVELYEDMVSISIKDITNEQLESLNAMINQKYGIDNSIEEIIVTNVPSVKLIDLIKPYILPVVISLAIIIIYILIYNAIYANKGREVNNAKVIVKLIISTIKVELLYLAILAIARLPINRLTIPLAIVLYIINTITILLKLEKEYSKIKE